jgi:hypothetical protein
VNVTGNLTVTGTTNTITGTGSNNIVGPHNNIGTTTADSVNTIGDAGTSINNINGVTTTITSTAGAVTDTLLVGSTTASPTGSWAVSNAATSNTITMNPGSGTWLVSNATTGKPEGLQIQQGYTVLSGGTHSSSLMLNDNGATFSNNSNGGGAPIQVHGVADGSASYDAVNVQQLNDVAQRSYRGIASVAALSGIPTPSLDPGQNFAFGFGAGYGYYAGDNAVAIGVKAQIGEHVTASAGVGMAETSGDWSDKDPVAGGGVLYKF